MSSVGPSNIRFEDGWECANDFLPCFKDCCLRGQQFCHVGAQRCQDCNTRIQQCGNNSLPWECDAFCLKRQFLDSSQATTGTGVSVAYLYATAVLAPVVLVLLLLKIKDTCLQRTCRNKPKTYQQSSNDNDEGERAALSTFEEPASVPPVHNGNYLSAFGMTTTNANHAPLSNAPPTILTSRPPTRQSHDASYPISGGDETDDGETDLSAQEISRSRETDTAGRDSRLENTVPSTSENENDVHVIHTGHVFSHCGFTTDD